MSTRLSVASAKTDSATIFHPPAETAYRLFAVVAARALPDGAIPSLVDTGIPVKRYASLQYLSESLPYDRIAIVLVDIEGCGGIEALIEDLLVFRVMHPSVILTLASRRILRDDLSTDRLAIADATLRLPLSQLRIEDGLVIARINNHVWQERCQQLCDKGRPIVKT